LRSDALILDAVRSPIGRRNGTLSGIRATSSRRGCWGLVSRQDVDPGEVEDVQMGCVTQIGEQGWNIGRMAVMAAGWPVEVCGTTVDRQCGSSMQTNFNAATAVMAGQLDVVISAGVEMMSRVPMGSNGGDLSELLERFEIVRRVSAEVLAESGACRARSSTRTRTSRTGALWRLSTREGSSARSSRSSWRRRGTAAPGRGRLRRRDRGARATRRVRR
jgi:hypothetical protein